MRGVGATIAVLVLLGSCSTAPSEPAIRFGGGLESCDECGGPFAGLTTVERWVEILAPAEEFADEDLIDASRSVVVDTRVVPVRSISSVGTPRTEPIDFHASYFPGIEWALTTGGRVFLALASEGLEREMVSYVLIRTAAGEHFFAGGGAFATFTDPFRRLLGDRYDSALDTLVGMTQRREIEDLLGIEDF
jgi:hypothetical protein